MFFKGENTKDIEEKKRQRSVSKKLRVIFPDGETICYSSSKVTYIETLKKIGTDNFDEINIEVCHLPLFTKEIYPQYKDDMEMVDNGWYVNTRGGVYNKAAQLKIISEQFNIGLTVDVSADFKGERVSRGSKNLLVLQITFPDGTVIGEENTTETFMQCVWKIGIEKVRQLNLLHGGKPLITHNKQYNNQIHIDSNKWLLVPSATKDKVKLLKVMNIMLHLNMDILFIS